MTAWGAASLVQMISTIQSSQTAHFVGDSKEAASAGISAVSSLDFLSLRTSAVSRAGFWPPVSASRNSVPGSWISRAKRAVRRLGNRGFWEAKMPFRAMAVIIANFVRGFELSAPFCRSIARAIALSAPNCRSFAKAAQFAKG